MWACRKASALKCGRHTGEKASPWPCLVDVGQETGTKRQLSKVFWFQHWWQGRAKEGGFVVAVPGRWEGQ